MPYTQFEVFLKRTIGLDALSIGTTMLERALKERLSNMTTMMSSSDKKTPPTLDDYWHFLQKSEAELNALIEAVVVPETWFFRHREAYTALIQLIQQQLQHNPTKRVRILSLPCSTGEEPYSIAMALFDAEIPAANFSIDAVDISARAIALAQQGRYRRNSFRGQPLDFQDRYFVQDATSGAFQLSYKVKQQVRLMVGNIFDPELLQDEAPYDIVFCRNVLIYFDRVTQVQAITILKKFITDDGALFVGPAETGLMLHHSMPPIKIAHAFAFRKTISGRLNKEPKKEVAGLSTLPSIMKPIPLSTHTIYPVQPALSSIPHTTHTAVEKRVANLARTMVRVTQLDKVFSLGASDTRATHSSAIELSGLKLATKLADEGRLVEAKSLCLQYVQQHGSTADTYHLMGIINDANNDTAAAIACYRKALYLLPSHAGALMHLAALLRLQGDYNAANVLHQRAQRSNVNKISS